MKKIMLFLSIIVLILSEIILSISPGIAFLFYSLLVGGILISISSLSENKNSEYSKEISLVLFILILPMMRMIELFVDFSFFWRTLIFYNSLLFLIVFYSFKFKIDIGYNSKKLWLLIFSIIFGVLLGLSGSYISYLTDLVKHPEIIIFIPLIAFTEEVLFRGLIQKSLTENYNPLYGIFISSLIYSIFSLSYNPFIALFLFFTGIISSLFYHYSKNIFPSIIFSILVNLFVFVI